MVSSTLFNSARNCDFSGLGFLAFLEAKQFSFFALDKNFPVLSCAAKSLLTLVLELVLNLLALLNGCEDFSLSFECILIFLQLLAGGFDVLQRSRVESGHLWRAGLCYLFVLAGVPRKIDAP